MFDLDLLAEALRLNIGITMPDNLRLFELLGRIHPLELRAYPSDAEHNGWVVPKAWTVHRALVRKDGAVLFDGTAHPMAVAGSSASFSGTITKEELDRHVFSSKSFPEAYAFHCMNNYRPWVHHWGLCIPWATYRDWPAGDYEVDLLTEFTPGEMLVAEARHPGASPDTVVFNAHTCHPCQANDDLVGVLVILEMFKRLAGRKTRWSYLGILAPEHLGTVFYLAGLSREERSRLKLGCFVEMVGSRGPLVLQQSFTGRSIMDRVAEQALRAVQPDLKVGSFRSIVGNDETVWEAPGIEVPMISVSRWPYPEYHTSRDDMGIVLLESLDQALDALLSMVDILEADWVPVRTYEGLVCLSNPRYNLYVQRPDPVVAKDISPDELRLGEIQDILPRSLNGTDTVFELAERFALPFPLLDAYLRRFVEKGLLEARPVTSLAQYERTPCRG